MSKSENFLNWLEVNKPKSVKNYKTGFNKINEILKRKGYTSLEDIELDDFDDLLEYLGSDSEYLNINRMGNNMYSATLTNYKEFLKEEMLIVPTIVKPFEYFGWRWATTGIMSYLNNPVYLKTVLDALLINGNGNSNNTIEFKELIDRVGRNKYEIDKKDIDKISKLTNPNIDKNIIENSGNYWTNLGLISESGKKAYVSEFGIDFLTGKISNKEFAIKVTESYVIPNQIYSKDENQLFVEHNIVIKPLKILLNTLRELHSLNIQEAYFTEEEVEKVIVPLSIKYNDNDYQVFSKHILNYRKNNLLYSQLPDCTSQYSGDKGKRMLNEYLYFMECFGLLKPDPETGVVRTTTKKYFLSDFVYENILSNNEIVRKKTETVYLKENLLPEKIIERFKDSLKNANLSFSSQLITRFIASLVTKPFVLLNGLSGSGKTKLAQAFVQWICQEESQYKIIPVGADWTNREPLLGYPDGLNNERYVTPDNGALQLMLDAINNSLLPYFMILDEMNLSHVERYFADFLSVMESEDTIKLYTGNIRKDSEGREIPKTIQWPSNLFIVGTVNIDETTYMFSPKVLDRANVIEFRLEEEDLEKYFANTKPIELQEVIGKGANMAHSFLSLAHSQSKNEDGTVQIELLKFFKELSKIGAEFGYRTANEVLQLIHQLSVLDHTLSDDTKIDIAVMQKLLPKLHGSRSKIVKVLNTLTALCLVDVVDFEISISEVNETDVKYPIAYAKLMRMYHNAIVNGFTSYAEA
ncbi:MAG: hypothetical protein LBI32_00330 [Myroides odoratus]|jgi:5-methylcytosine-specific restriction protein B|nr:hypothetical protein [Myroides odoratus]